MELLAEGEVGHRRLRRAAGGRVSSQITDCTVCRAGCRGGVKLSDILVLAERASASWNAAAVFVGGAAIALRLYKKDLPGPRGVAIPADPLSIR